MAEINTGVWGDNTDWHDVAVYDQTLDAAQKCKNTDEVIELWQDTKLTVNDAWDLTLSYCGLGTESTLSNIKFLRRVIPYFIYPENWDGSKFDELVVNYDEEDTRNITNFAIGSTEVYASRNQHMCQFKSDMASLSLEQYGPIFQRWAPLSRADEAMQWIVDHEQPGSSPDPWCNVASSIMYAQIPVKNFVAIPYITCVNSIATKRLENSGDLSVVDLATYLTAEQDEQHPHASYLTHPYILQVCLRFVQSDSLADFNNHVRDLILNPSTCFILDETNMYSDINPDCKANDEEGYDFTTAYMYNQLMNWFGAPNSGMPILGLTSIPGDWHWRDGWPISFGPSDIYQYGDTLPNLKDVSGRYNFPIWIGSQYLEEHAIMNDNPTTASEATDGAYVYYMSAGNNPAELREKIRRAVACFGLFFVDGYDDKDVALDDNKMMLGILVDGIGHGDYSRGEENRDQDQWNWDDMHENNYDPETPPDIDPNEYDKDNRSELRVPLYAQIGGHSYITSGRNFQEAYDEVMDELRSAMNSAAGSTADLVNACDAYEADPTDSNYEAMEKALKSFNARRDSYDGRRQKFDGIHSNPVDCVKSIIAFPFDLTNYISSTAKSEIVWGTTTAHTETPTSGDFNLIDGCKSQFWVPGGSCSYFAEYKNFLDYSPYCSAELYIPYCGSVNIDPETFIGHELTVRYLVDWHTGSCLALVYRDSLIVEQVSGQIGISIPMIAADELSYGNSLFQGSQDVKHAQISSIATTVSGLTDGFIKGFKAVAIPTPTNIAGAIGSAVNDAAAMANSWNSVKSAEYELATKQLSYKQLTTASPMTSSGNEQVCRLVIYRPTFLDGYSKSSFGNYGHTTGFACLENKQLKNFTGLTVCSSVDLSGIATATAKEKEMINAALKTGVYIKKSGQ